MPNSGETIVTSNSTREKAKNIVDAHAELQRYSVLEMNDGETHERMFAWDQVIEFFAIGFKIFLAGFFVCLIMVPMAVAVQFGIINMYGGTPNLYDKIFIFILAFSMTFGAVVIVLQMAKFVEGPITYKMVKSLYTGAISSALIKGLVLFILFQFAATLITPDNILTHLNIIIRLLPNVHSIAASTPYELAVNLVAVIKPVFRISAVIMAIFGLLTALILSIFLFRARLKFKDITETRAYIDNKK